ncbi:MAG: hypothetical protein ABIS06_22340 [Vicinamibacterales bacterium]
MTIVQVAVHDAVNVMTQKHALAARNLTEDDPGIVIGETAAASVLAARATDGAAQAQFAYTAPGAGDPGVWVAIGTTPALLPGWGAVTPWVMKSGSQFRPDGPPSRDSGRYARDHNEVHDLGALKGLSRTADQTETAKYTFNLWRPLAAIRNGRLDDNDATTGDLS